MTTSSELSALIVRSIADVERINLHLEQEMLPQLEKAVGAIFSDMKRNGWHVDDSADEIDSNWLGKSEWIDPKNPDDTQFCCTLDASGPSDESWLANFTQTAPSGVDVGIYISNWLGGRNQAVKKAFNSDAKRRSKMLRRGWELDHSQQPRVPVVIEVTDLAAAFEDGDLEPALAPLRKAIEIVFNSGEDLDAMRTEIASR